MALLTLGRKALGSFIESPRFWAELRRELAPEIEEVFRDLFQTGVELGLAVTPVRGRSKEPEVIRVAVQEGALAPAPEGLAAARGSMIIVAPELTRVLRSGQRPGRDETVYYHGTTEGFEGELAAGSFLTPRRADAMVFARIADRLAGNQTAINAQISSINSSADLVFATYIDDWWLQFQQSTQNSLRRAIVRSVQEGTGVEGVIDELTPIFGANRAALIGVTETTRLLGLGAQATYAANGLEEWQWQTVRDPFVCPVCGPLQGERFPIDVPFAPRHPRCRCFPRPVVPGD